jgi:formylglycine-generating enzyme required for sulfatase activity
MKDSQSKNINFLLKTIAIIFLCSFIISCGKSGGGGGGGSNGTISGNETDENSSSNSVFTCPNGFILVPKNLTYVTEDFCVAKYEMKNKAGVASSQADLTPWVNITRDQAITQCQSLGDSYDLITNAQWQTIARNIEAVSSNWTTGSSASGNLFIGNSGGTGALLINGYDGADPEYGSNRNSKAKLILNNGNEIWDLAGNVLEWVKDANGNSFCAGSGVNASTYPSQLSDTTHPLVGILLDGVNRTAKDHFGPAGDFSSRSSLPWGGLGATCAVVSNESSLSRGGFWSAGGAGIFYVKSFTSSFSDNILGFRCVFHKN